MAYDVVVEASNPGARIVANGQQLTNTPVHIKIFGDRDGTFHDFGSPYYMVEALPLATNQFTQVRYFGTGHLFGPEDRIPERIYFDMNHPQPPPPTVYVYPPAHYYYDWPPYFYYGPEFDFYSGPRHYHRWR